MANWPATLPGFLGGGDYAPLVENVASTSMESGAPKRRRRFTSVPETFSTTVLLNPDQYETLRDFV